MEMTMEGYTPTLRVKYSRKSNKELTTGLNNFVSRWIYGTEDDQRKLKHEIRRKTGLNLT